MGGIRCDACGRIFDVGEKTYSDFWYDQSDEGRCVDLCVGCRGPLAVPCPSCVTLRAELAAARAEVERLRLAVKELDAWLSERVQNWKQTRQALNASNHPTVVANARGYENGSDATREKLRELGLVTEDGDG